MDAKLLEILVCPVTKGPLVYDRDEQELVSKSARLAYPIRDGIPVMLEEEARRLAARRESRSDAPVIGVHRPHPGALRLDAAAGQAARRHRGQADGGARRGARDAERRRARRGRHRPRAGARRGARAHGIAACMTRDDHPTGTDRLAEAAAALGLADDDIVVNVQGDEPLLDPALMRRMAELLDERTGCRDRHRLPSDRRRGGGVQPERRQGGARRARLRAVLQPRDDSVGARRVRGSRDALPPGLPIYRHYGLYAYRSRSCAPIRTSRRRRSSGFEALEQLRALWHGYRIAVDVTHGTPAPGIDTPEDLERVRCLRGAANVPGRRSVQP